MLKQLKYICCAALLCLMFAGCASQINEGEIISKQFVPAHEESTMRYDVLQETFVYETEHIPDRWYVTIEKKCEDGKVRQRKLMVSQGTYNSVTRGEWFGVE